MAAKRGRKSATERDIDDTVVDINKNKNTKPEKPSAPAHLTKEQKAEWTATVNRLPDDWFPRETWPLLEQYCRHVVASRDVAKLISTEQRKNDKDVDKLDKLLKMQEREGRAISSLATRMRLTQQSTVDPERKKPPASGRKPWQG